MRVTTFLRKSSQTLLVHFDHIQRVEPTPARRVGIYGSFYLPLGIFSGLILIPKLFQPDDQQASQRVANPLRSENGPDRPTAEGEEFLLPSTTATVQASFAWDWIQGGKVVELEHGQFICLPFKRLPNYKLNADVDSDSRSRHSRLPFLLLLLL